jgi:hypothetical protein
MIPGNHEFYDGEYHDTLARMRASAARHEIHLLENDALVIGDVRFLGCTLWTDFRLFENAGRPLQLTAEQAVEASRRMVPDFRTIRFAHEGSERPFAWQDWVSLHAYSRAWLAAELSRDWPGRTVVITHHLPSWLSVHPGFTTWASNAAFASDLDGLIERATLWIHGHTHTTQRYRVGNAQVVCNPRGYPRRRPLPADTQQPQAEQALVKGGQAFQGAGPALRYEFENASFDPALIVDLDSL